MSRYKARLVPGEAIRRPLELAVRLTPKAAPQVEVETTPPACVSECGGFGVTVDGTPQSGEFYILQNETPDAIAIHVEHLGTLCDGDCIEWSVRNIMNGSGVLSSIELTPDGCNAVDIAIPHDVVEDWAGVWFGLFATINGHPFCETVIFTTQTPVVDCESPPDFVQWMQDIDPSGAPFNGGTTVDPYTGVLPNAAFNAYFAPSDVFNDSAYFDLFCGAALEGTIVSIDGPDPDAFGDFTVDNTGVGVPGAHLSANGAHDYTGITLQIAVNITSPFSGSWGANIVLSF